MTMEFLWNSSSGTRILVQYNNFDDYQILQELDDHEILVKFQMDFDQNSFKIWMTTKFFKNFDQNSFQELDDHRIVMKFFEDFNQNSDDHKILLKFFKNFDQIFLNN